MLQEPGKSTINFHDLIFILRIMTTTEELLNNPVYHALTKIDARLGSGSGQVRYFDEEVSPFAGFPESYEKGFSDLLALLPAGRKILYATRKLMMQPAGWKELAAISGLQFVYEGEVAVSQPTIKIDKLDKKNAGEMVALAALTKPGPFAMRTIEFGDYFGIFESGRLAAMTGERLHVNNYTEISAVCTHPDHIGKGYAAALLQYQLKILLAKNEKPFLHVRSDNVRAIALYERLGFIKNGAMNFYFLKKL
jgi:ribosomal protein S18 acetylase RimI-like enzyme